MKLSVVLNLMALTVSVIMAFYLVYKMPGIIRKKKSGELPKYQPMLIVLVILSFVFLIIDRAGRL